MQQESNSPKLVKPHWGLLIIQVASSFTAIFISSALSASGGWNELGAVIVGFWGSLLGGLFSLVTLFLVVTESRSKKTLAEPYHFVSWVTILIPLLTWFLAYLPSTSIE